MERASRVDDTTSQAPRGRPAAARAELSRVHGNHSVSGVLSDSLVATTIYRFAKTPPTSRTFRLDVHVAWAT